MCGPLENRLLLTGLHTIADIYCTCCNANLGWKYVRTSTHAIPTSIPNAPEQTTYAPAPAGRVARPGSRLPRMFPRATWLCRVAARPPQEEAFEESQKYKEGKIILEKATICKLRGA